MITVGEMSLILIGFFIGGITIGEIIHYFRIKFFNKQNPYCRYEYFIDRSDSYCYSFICIIILLFLYGFIYNMIVNFNVPLN